MYQSFVRCVSCFFIPLFFGYRTYDIRHHHHHVNQMISFIFTTEYQTLKLMQLSISKINDVCQSLLDNLQLDKLIPTPPIKRPALYSAKGIKNTRRHMEDRHIIIDDFNQVFGIKVITYLFFILLIFFFLHYLPFEWIMP